MPDTKLGFGDAPTTATELGLRSRSSWRPVHAAGPRFLAERDGVELGA